MTRESCIAGIPCSVCRQLHGRVRLPTALHHLHSLGRDLEGLARSLLVSCSLPPGGDI